MPGTPADQDLQTCCPERTPPLLGHFFTLRLSKRKGRLREEEPWAFPVLPVFLGITWGECLADTGCTWGERRGRGWLLVFLRKPLTSLQWTQVVIQTDGVASQSVHGPTASALKATPSPGLAWSLTDLHLAPWGFRAEHAVTMTVNTGGGGQTPAVPAPLCPHTLPRHGAFL